MGLAEVAYGLGLMRLSLLATARRLAPNLMAASDGRWTMASALPLEGGP
jgi:hypothetical protein